MRELTIGYIIGSLSSSSINRKYTDALIKRAAPGIRFVEIPIDQLPIYNRDLDADFPSAAVTLKEQIAEVDAILFVTPEHNRSIPAALKNVLDFASRPSGTSAWFGKPAAIIGVSGGAIGTAVAQDHLRSLLPNLGLTLMGRPEMYIRNTDETYDSEGGLAASYAKRADAFLASFTAFVRLQRGER